MPRTPLRTLGALAVIAGAGILTTCTTDAAGPGRRGAFAVEPVLPPMLHLSAFNLTVDNVRLTVVRPPSETVYDTTVAFPANQSSLQLSADIPLDQSPESFDVTIQMLYGSQLLFSGTQSVLVSEGSNNTPAQIPLTYAGPGQNITTLSIDPPDSLLTWDGTLAFRTTALDAHQSPVTTVTSYYLSWSTNDATVAIDATGQLTAPHFRKTVTVTAMTPTNISASTTLTLLPAPSAITVTSGCGQTAAPGSQLPQPVIAKVIAADNGGVQGVTVTFTPPSGGTAVPAQVVTDANGLAQSVVTLGSTPGPQQFVITAPGVSAFNCNQTATGGTTQLAFTTQPSGGIVAGAGFSVVVTAKDLSGNTVASFTGNVTLGLGANPSGATFGNPTVAAAAGVATFPGVSINKTGTGYTLTATSSGVTSATSAPFDVTAAAPASVVKISGDNQTGAGGAALAQPLVVEVLDAFANPVTGATVAWATPSGGSLAPPSGPTGVNGQAQATWTLGSSAPSQAATATVGALTPASFSATANIGSPAISLSFAGIPGVGVGLTSKVYVDINQVAPVGGTTVSVASSDQSVFTVAPPSVTIAQGKTRDSVTVAGVSPGQNALTATASGFTTGSLTVVVQNRNISVPVTLNVPYGQTASLPIQLPAPAPAGGVTFTVVTGTPANVSVVTSSVTIPAGGQTANATLNGVFPGPATITVSNPAYVDGVTNATTSASLNIVQSSASLNASFGTSITINFESNGSATFAPAPGISVTLTPSNPTCLAVTSPISIVQGLVNTTATLTYGGSATLPCTTKLLAQATNLLSDSINVTVNPVPGITVNAVTVGSGLQIGSNGNLGASNHGGVTVTVTSRNPNVLLSTSPSVAGSSSINVFVPNSQTSFSYTVQALEGQTGTTPIEVVASAPGFATDSGTVSLVQGAIDLIGVPANTTTLSPTNVIYARTGIPNSQVSPTSLIQLENVRAGAPGPLTVTFNSQTPAVGDLVKAGPSFAATQTAQIPLLGSNSPTDTTSGGVLFRPKTTGSTTVSASVTGFLSVTSATGSTANVTQPGIIVNATTVGSGLQIGSNGNLGASNHGGVTVTVISRSPNLLLSTSPSTAGSDTITVFVPNNQTSFSYTVQALEGQTGTTPIEVVASAPGFATDSGTVSLVQGAIDLIGVPANTTTLSPTNNIYTRVGIPNSQVSPTSLTQLEAVRAGAPGNVTVTFTSLTAAVGVLVKAGPVSGASQTALIPVLGFNTPTDTTSGGVLFRPLVNGSTTITASAPGYLAVTSAAGSTVNVTQPGITVNAVTVGSGLQIGSNGNLGASNHGGTLVSLISSNPAVLLSPNTTTPGTDSIAVFVPNNQTSFSYVVQGLEGQVGTVTAAITAKASGFTDGTGTVAVVPPAFDVIGLPSTPIAGSADVAFYVRVGIANSTYQSLTQLQQVRSGAPGSLTATVTSNAPSIGTLVVTAGAGTTQQVTIPVLGTNSPTSVATGGVAFRPVAAGPVIITTTIPGYVGTVTATTTITVQ